MKKLKVLILDDSPVMRKIVERALRQAGLDIAAVLEASNGAEALVEVQKGSLDLILSDINKRAWIQDFRLRDFPATRNSASVYRFLSGACIIETRFASSQRIV